MMDNDLRVASIVALAQEAQTKRLGKVQMQKLVYFAQHSGIPLEYKYEIYHYGPYSFELSHQLDSLDSLGVLRIESDPNGFGFDISTGKFADKFTIPTKYRKKLDQVITQFGSNSAAQLEVKATIHFVRSVIGGKATKAVVIDRVRALKPRFNQEFVKNCYSDLEKSGWL